MDLFHVDDGAGHAGGDDHGQEGPVDDVALEQAEGDVAGAQGLVDAELLTDLPYCFENDPASRSVGACGGARASMMMSWGGIPSFCARSMILPAMVTRRSTASVDYSPRYIDWANRFWKLATLASSM